MKKFLKENFGMIIMGIVIDGMALGIFTFLLMMLEGRIN